MKAFLLTAALALCWGCARSGESPPARSTQSQNSSAKLAAAKPDERTWHRVGAFVSTGDGRDAPDRSFVFHSPFGLETQVKFRYSGGIERQVLGTWVGTQQVNFGKDAVPGSWSTLVPGTRELFRMDQSTYLAEQIEGVVLELCTDAEARKDLEEVTPVMMFWAPFPRKSPSFLVQKGCIHITIAADDRPSICTVVVFDEENRKISRYLTIPKGGEETVEIGPPQMIHLKVEPLRNDNVTVKVTQGPNQ